MVLKQGLKHPLTGIGLFKDMKSRCDLPFRISLSRKQTSFPQQRLRLMWQAFLFSTANAESRSTSPPQSRTSPRGQASLYLWITQICPCRLQFPRS